MESVEATRISLRAACSQDFGYCERLYFAGMAKIIQELNLEMTAQIATFRKQWEVAQVRIITLDGADAGWLQSTTRGDNLFLAQIFVDGDFQQRGIGTEVMRRLIGEASRAGRAVTLGVVKTNPALRLYKRLGFRVTHDDERKFYLRRDPDGEALILN
jgi:ribosomal protein S18 acetylase RimI-like enzyme